MRLIETNFFYSRDHSCTLLIPKIIVKIKSFNATFKMEAFLANAYMRLDQKSKLFETNSIAIGTKELHQRKIYIFFLQNGFLKSL